MFFTKRLVAKVVPCGYFDGKMGCKKVDLYDGEFYYAQVIGNTRITVTFLRKASICQNGLGKKIKVTYKGRSIIAKKGEVIIKKEGEPKDLTIKLHIVAAKALGFDLNKGIDYVTVEDLD